MRTPLTFTALFLAALPCAAQNTNFQNFIRQVQSPHNPEERTVWNVPVEAEGTDLSNQQINAGGARFELHTVSSDPFAGYLLDTKHVSAYTPVAEVIIRTEDPYETVPRTRADRPFYVDITTNGLLSGENDPEASKKVKVLHHVQSYGPGGDGSGVDRTQATLIGQGILKNNDTFRMTYAVNSVPGGDRTKVRGEERFSVFSWANKPDEQSHLDSLYVQIWPVADGTLSGISPGQLIRFQAPTVTISVNDIYPDAEIYAQVYPGSASLGTEGTIVPGSALIIKESVPQNRILTLEDWDHVLTSDGVWTMELLTSTPFGIDRLAHVSFNVDRTISVNGSVTTIE